ncbi:MAG: hypothetical protein RL117_1160 [Verrucomicrobiota bacterium]|jgi:hypothetical protein
MKLAAGARKLEVCDVDVNAKSQIFVDFFILALPNA